MGLDMYINIKSEVEDEPGEEIYYWRKFNPLQGWFEEHHNLDNCEEIVLTLEILDQIEADARDGKMKSTEGFFYGGEWNQEEIMEALMPGLKVAHKAINEGQTITYHAWW